MTSRHLNSKSARHRRNIRLEEQNNHYRHNYAPFIIPTSFYNIVHVHRYTTLDTISTLINHFESCYRYSIDTESDRFTYDLSLIQVHTIPENLPAFIVLFELNHFPSSTSLLFDKIKSLFHLLFRLGNIIFSWGSMSMELRLAVHMNFFPWPPSALMIDLQNEFFSWYQGAQPPCEACCPIQLSNMIAYSTSSCNCSINVPYVDPSQKWSLQNAVLYTINRFLDKSSTQKNWSVMLDSSYSPLSSYEQQKRLNYAIYDCFAVTLLHKAIYERWSLSQLREAELRSLFTSNASLNSSSLSSTMLVQSNPDDKLKNKSRSLFNSTVPIGLALLEDISEDESEDDLIYVLSSSRDPPTSFNVTRKLKFNPLIIMMMLSLNPFHLINNSNIRIHLISIIILVQL